MLRPRVAGATIFLLISLTQAGFASATDKLDLLVGGSTQPWGKLELGQLKQVSTHEKDPVTGKMIRSHGVLLSDLIDKALSKLPPDRKAQVDLVVLKHVSGTQVLLPRSLVTKYPLLVSTEASSYGLVVPWTSRPKILSEGLPLQSYFVSDLGAI